jgi:hypothetical protein
MEQYNKLCKCLTTSKAQIVFKGVTWRNGKKTFYYKYYYKENFGFKLLVANSIQGYSWIL